MTKVQAVEFAEKIIPLIYKQPSEKDRRIVDDLHDSMLWNEENLAKAHAYWDTLPSYAEVFTDVFLKDWITE